MRGNWRGIGLLALLLTGCAGGHSLRPFIATNAEDALSEISTRRRLCRNFKSPVVFQLDIGSGNVRLNGDLDLREGKFWQVSMNGPLGVKLIRIETDLSSYRINNLHTGQVQEGFLEDPVSLPEINLDLPSMDFLGGLMLPLPDVEYPQDWRIVGHSVNSLTLREIYGDTPDSLVLALSYSPLRILHEERWRNSEKLYRKDYIYRAPQSILPEAVRIEIGGVEIGLQYHNPTLRRARTSHTQQAPY